MFRHSIAIVAILGLSACAATGSFSGRFESISGGSMKVPSEWASAIVSHHASATPKHRVEHIRFDSEDFEAEFASGQLIAGSVWTERPTSRDYKSLVRQFQSISTQAIVTGPQNQRSGAIGIAQTWPIENGIGSFASCIGYYEQWGAQAKPNDFRNRLYGYVCAPSAEQAEARLSEFLGQADVQPRYYVGKGLTNVSGGDGSPFVASASFNSERAQSTSVR